MLELVRVTIQEKDILNNLLEKYLYEFSQWDNQDVNEKGLYEYTYLNIGLLCCADGKICVLYN